MRDVTGEVNEFIGKEEEEAEGESGRGRWKTKGTTEAI